MPLFMTGHPFIDIGLATLTVMAGERRLVDLTEDELRAAAEKLKYWYSSHNAARNYISTVFTNSHFTQPSMSQEQREAYANRYLFAFLKDHVPQDGEPHCAYFPKLAAVERAYRQHIPLLNGEEIGNFSALGHDGLPVSGLALLAIHAMPFGCLKCGGRLLGFHQQSPYPDDPNANRIMITLTDRNWTQNKNALVLLSADEKEKFPDFGGRAKLRYITRVIDAREAIASRNGLLDYLTGYYFTNYGASAEMSIIRLDHTVMRFIERVLQEATDAWTRAVYLNWNRGKKGELENDDETRIASGRRNDLYERLFSLPDYPLPFLAGLKRARNWNLIEIFLQEVLLMDQTRIDTYKRLGDLLADYALNKEWINQPASFYYGFSRARAYVALRGTIRTAAETMYKHGAQNLLFTYDDFIQAFEDPGDRYSQWRLARDLISIRLLERLHKANIDFSNLPEDENNLESEEDN